MICAVLKNQYKTDSCAFVVEQWRLGFKWDGLQVVSLGVMQKMLLQNVPTTKYYIYINSSTSHTCIHVNSTFKCIIMIFRHYKTKNYFNVLYSLVLVLNTKLWNQISHRWITKNGMNYWQFNEYTSKCTLT